MVVIYVPEDKRWEKLGQGLGGLLGSFVEGAYARSINEGIAEMSKDPQYANDPTKLRSAIAQRYGLTGTQIYDKSMDSALKQAQLVNAQMEPLVKKADIAYKEAEIAKITDPALKQKLQLELDQLKAQIGHTEVLTEAEKLKMPYIQPQAGATLEKTTAESDKATAERKQTEAATGGFNAAGYGTPTPPATPSTGPQTPVAPPPAPAPSKTVGPRSELTLPQGGEDVVLDSLGRPVQKDTAVQLAAYFGPDETPNSKIMSDGPTTVGPPQDPLRLGGRFGGMGPQPGAAPQPVMPSLPVSDFGVGGGANLPSAAPPAPLPQPQIPSIARPSVAAPRAQPPSGPAQTPDGPAQRRLQPQSSVMSTPYISPAPPGSPAEPVPAASSVPPGSTAASAPPITVEEAVPEAVKKRLAGMGITDPKEQMRVYDVVRATGGKNWATAERAEIDKITQAHEVERRYQQTQEAEQSRFEQRLNFDKDKSDRDYYKPQVMPEPFKSRLPTDDAMIATLKPFMDPGAPTGGLFSRLEKWYYGRIEADPEYTKLATYGDMAVQSMATTGSGFIGKERIGLAELNNPGTLHYNYVDVLRNQAIAKNKMDYWATAYKELEHLPGQEGSLRAISDVWNNYKSLYDDADTLWWAQSHDPSGQAYGDFHFYYRGREVDKYLRPVQGSNSMLPAEQVFRNNKTGLERTGAALNDMASEVGWVPAELYHQDWSPVGR